MLFVRQRIVMFANNKSLMSKWAAYGVNSKEADVSGWNVKESERMYWQNTFSHCRNSLLSDLS